mmetsp:Transcript_5968/g.20576  ORF Transcript_5968/g.20576 Transcript_5968/m.20576 type:complete len:340 (-) Transcript_5968:1553-2572(-)
MALVEEFLREGGGAGEASTSAGGDGDGARGSAGLPEAFSFAASLFPLRSLALDAQVLDDSLGQQLRTEVSRATSLLPARTVLRVQAEVKLLVEVSVLALTVGLGRPTPGMEILSLRHQNRLSALQRALLCTVGPGSRWLAERFETLASSRNMAEAESGWELLAWRSYCFASLSSSVLKTLNLCLFFRNGKYSTLTERVLGVTKVYEDPMIVRAGTLGVLDDHLFWLNLYDFVTDMTPLASRGLRGLGSLAERAKLYALGRLEAIGLKAASGRGAQTDKGPGENKGLSCCGICGKDPVASLVRAHPCGHEHCYFCLATRLASSNDFRCKVCGARVEGIAR